MKRFNLKLKKYYGIFAILSILLFLPIQNFAQAAHKTVYHKGVKKKSVVKRTAKKIVKTNPGKNQPDSATIAPGDWGGTGIEVTVQKGKIEIGFDCADGVINNSLATDQDGNFRLEGSYTPRGRGPVRTGFPPQNQNVYYEGKITGSDMNLKIVSKSDGKLISEFTLVKNVTAKLRRCY